MGAGPRSSPRWTAGRVCEAGDVYSLCGATVCVRGAWFRCASGCRAASGTAGCGGWASTGLLAELRKTKVKRRQTCNIIKGNVRERCIYDSFFDTLL